MRNDKMKASIRPHNTEQQPGTLIDSRIVGIEKQIEALDVTVDEHAGVLKSYLQPPSPEADKSADEAKAYESQTAERLLHILQRLAFITHKVSGLTSRLD